MRNILNPKRFYKTPDSKTLPKYFHVGTLEDNASDFYSKTRATKKTKRMRLIDELMKDVEKRKYNKRKYLELTKVGGGAGVGEESVRRKDGGARRAGREGACVKARPVCSHHSPFLAATEQVRAQEEKEHRHGRPAQGQAVQERRPKVTHQLIFHNYPALLHAMTQLRVARFWVAVLCHVLRICVLRLVVTPSTLVAILIGVLHGEQGIFSAAVGVRYLPRMFGTVAGGTGATRVGDGRVCAARDRGRRGGKYLSQRPCSQGSMERKWYFML